MSSSSSANRLPTAAKGSAAAKPMSIKSGASTGRRRSSGGSDAGRFSGLIDLKRNSQDASAAARKASFHEQRPQPGFLGQIWHNFTKGHHHDEAAGSK